MSTLSTRLAAAAKSYLLRYALKHFVGEPEISTLARGLVDKNGNVVVEADGATPPVTLGGTQTLTNKTLTSPVLTAPVLTGCTANGGAAIDFSGSSGAFNTSTGLCTFGGGVVDAVQALSGAGAVDVVTGVTRLTTTGTAQALTLANGTPGQRKTIVHEVDGGSAVLTPTTKTGFATITFTNVGDACELTYLATRGWMIVSLRGATAA